MNIGYQQLIAGWKIVKKMLHPTQEDWMESYKSVSQLEIEKYLNGDDDVIAKIMTLSAYAKWKVGGSLPPVLSIRLEALRGLQQVLDQFTPAKTPTKKHRPKPLRKGCSKY